jgi:hypothetical protein
MSVKLIWTRREGITEAFIALILDFQTVLLEKSDVACHTFAETPKLTR